MTKHPELIATLLDILVDAKEPLATSTIGSQATTRLRRALGPDGYLTKAGVTEQDVMTFNPSPGRRYYEVTGSTVSAVLSKRDDVVMSGMKKAWGGQQKHWALTSKVERWAVEEEARLTAVTEAQERYVVRETSAKVRVVDLRRDGNFASPDEAAVAVFDTTAMPVDVARELAERVKRTMVRVSMQATAS